MELDREQKLAAEAQEKRILVVSAAGSGKTRTLTARISYLINEKKVSAYEIFTGTFTRAAANNMKERLEPLIGTSAVNHLTIGTFHGIALGLLHRFGDQLGLKPKSLTIYSQFEENYLLKDVAIELGAFKKSWKIPKKDIDEVFGNYYGRGELPKEIHPAHDLFNAFIVRMRENNSLSYGALLVGFKILIPIISKYLNWRYVLVDEVQDHSEYMWDITNDLCKFFNASLFAVGDVSQSLYQWRMASPEYLINHQNEFKIYNLSTNYRSVPKIVKSANVLIENNTMRLPLTMKPFRESDSDQSIKVHRGMNSAVCVQFIKALLMDEKPEDIAVLCRIHAPLKKLSKLLDEAGIEHAYIGKKSDLTGSEEFRRVHSFLKLIINPFDNFSYLMLVNLIGISRSEYQDIRIKAAEIGQSHFQVWMSGYNNAFTEFFRTAGDNSLAALAFAIKYMATGAVPFPSEGWEFDVEPSFQFIFSWLKDNPNGTIREYLDFLAVFDLQDEVAENDKKLMLSSVHGFKGLERKIIILAGVNEGILPSKQAIKSNDTESERRLMYVAVTRAEDKLILAVRPEQKLTESGKILENPKSRFIEEMKL